MFGKKKAVSTTINQLVNLHHRIGERESELAEIEAKVMARSVEIEALSSHLNVLNSISGAMEARQELEIEFEKRKKELDNLMAILREFYGVEDAIAAKNSLASEIASLEQRIANLKIELGAYQSLKNIKDEVAALEERRRLLEAHPNRKFKTSGVIIASYYPDIYDDENLASYLMPFIYNGSVSYVYDDEKHIAAEYSSIGGSRWAAIAEGGEYLTESKKRTYNIGIGEYVTLEDVCVAIGSNLYLEEYVTLDEIKELVNLVESVYFADDNDYYFPKVLDLLRKAEARARKKNSDIPV